MSSFKYTPENEAKFQEYASRYPKIDSCMLPALWLVQEQEGWVSPEAMVYVAEKVQKSPMQVYEVATFYTMFNLKPIGKYHIELCKTVSCMLMGARELKAFIKELKSLYKKNPKKVASNLVGYLVGNKDFYKVIKGKNSVEIHAYNLNGTLNLPFDSILPKYETPRVPLPTEIVDIDFKLDSNTTAIVTMNNDWVLSFRIHNASSRVESSLKFDINLLNSPKKLFKNTLNISHD